jgi:hypothetical protein
MASAPSKNKESVAPPKKIKVDALSIAFCIRHPCHPEYQSTVPSTTSTPKKEAPHKLHQ